jgi:uncharacterized membrane protein
VYCPNCAQPTSTEQKFCRSCGLSLEKAAQSLVEQLPAAELNKDLRERQRRVERLLYILGGSAGVIFIVTLFWTVINEIISGEVPLLGGLIFLAFILGLVAFALLMLYRQSLLKASSKRPSTQPTLPEAEPTARLLPESYVEPIPTVTERTTELLVAEKKKRSW